MYTYEHPSELLDLHIESDTPPGQGVSVDAPLYLVCTHGKKDPCCAVFGRPLAHFLSGVVGQVFESTHLGGDRFAGGIVTLPDGSYYGHLDPATAEVLADGHRAGHLTLAHYRGRCVDSQPVQIAEHAVRTLHRLTGIGDVRPHAPVQVGPDIVVQVDIPDASVTVRLASAPQSPRRTTCRDPEMTSPDHGRVVSMYTTLA